MRRGLALSGALIGLLLAGCSSPKDSPLSEPLPPGGSAGQTTSAAGATGSGSAAGSGGTAGAATAGGQGGQSGSAGSAAGDSGSGGSGGASGGSAGAPAIATNFTCSQVIGLMITGEWYNEGFEDGVDGSKWQLKNQHYGYVGVWIDPNSEFWNAPITSPCAEGSESPDRVIFTAVDWEFTTQGQWETALEGVIATIKLKYPAVRLIELMTMIRCPDNGVCNENAVIGPGSNMSAPLQDCQVTDYQDAAMALVAANHPGEVIVAPKFESPACREPVDGAHLGGENNAAVAVEIAAHYAANP